MSGTAPHPHHADSLTAMDRDWPHLDLRALTPVLQARVSARQAALQSYAQGIPVRQIQAQTGVSPASLYRCLAKARQLHADGRPWGYRALVPYVRVAGYERLAEPKRITEGKAGNAGAFSQLLERNPSLRQLLVQEIKTGAIELVPSGTGTRLKGIKGVIRKFQKRCLELGLTRVDYPFNQVDLATRSLARTVSAILTEQASLSAHAAATRIKPESALRTAVRDAPSAFDTVEFDAHKLDLRLKLILGRDPTGGEHSVLVERAWLLAIIDVSTRCILGWHMVFGKECNRYDVVEAICSAVLPAERPTLSLPSTRLMEDGGFVNAKFEQTRYALFRQIRLDNARAHLSGAALSLMCDTLGAQVDFGPAYSPDDRPFIERFFGTVVQTFSRRLPGAIEPGNSAERTRLLKRLRQAGGNDRLVISASELKELLAMMVWNYNGTPHSSLGGLTPLEAMEHHVLGIGREPTRLRYLPQPLQREPRLLHEPVDCVVHGNAARGQRPYLTYMHVRYTSDQFAKRHDLIGQVVRVHVDPLDLRQVTVVTQRAEVLEPLLASGVWRHQQHSLWLRQQYFAARRAKQLGALSAEFDPIGDFVAHRKTVARSSKRAATTIAKLEHERSLRAEEVGRGDTASPADTQPVLAQWASGPVRAKPLKIQRGFSR